eukprot:6213741-Pleurochrysis_carterae.AAC.2
MKKRCHPLEVVKQHVELRAPLFSVVGLSVLTLKHGELLHATDMESISLASFAIKLAVRATLLDVACWTPWGR